jgi:hypothetical protein
VLHAPPTWTTTDAQNCDNTGVEEVCKGCHRGENNASWHQSDGFGDSVTLLVLSSDDFGVIE